MNKFRDVSPAHFFSPLTLLFLISLLLLSGCEKEEVATDNFKLANFYFEQKNDVRALHFLSEEIRAGKRKQEAFQLMGQILNEAEYYADAQASYQAAINLGCAEICVEGLIESFIGQGLFKQARQEFISNIKNKSSEKARYYAVVSELDQSRDIRVIIRKLEKIDYSKARDLIMRLMLKFKFIDEIRDSYDSKKDYTNYQLLAFATVFYLKKDYQESEEILQQLRIRDTGKLLTKNKIQTVELLVKVNIALDKYTDADAIYKAFLENNKGSSYVAYKKAIAELKNSNFEEAINEISNLSKSSPDNLEMLKVLALAHFGKGNYSEVITLLEKHRKDLDDTLLLVLADSYNAQGRPQDTIELLNRKKIANPLRISLARAHLLKREEGVARKLSKSISVIPDNNSYNRILARLWYDLGQYDLVLNAFSADSGADEAIKFVVINSFIKTDQKSRIEPYLKTQGNDEFALKMRGLIAEMENDYSKAKTIYEKLTQKNQAVGNFELVAAICLKLKDYACSTNAVEKALQLPGNKSKTFIIASRLLKLSHEGKLWRQLNLIESNHSEFKNIQSLLADYEIEKDLNEDAIARLAPFLKDGDAQIFFLMAKAKFKTNPDEATSLLEDSLNASYKPKVAILLQRYYSASNDLPKLRKILQKIEATEPLNLNVTRTLSRGYFKLNDHESLQKLANNLRRQGAIDTAAGLEANLLVSNKQYAEAVHIYEQLAGKNKSEALFLKLFNAKILAKPGSIKVILAEAEKVLKQQPDQHRLREFIGLKYIDIDNKAALDHLSYLNTKFPGNPVLLNNLGWISLDLDPDKALIYAKQAYQISPTNLSIVDTYVQALKANNQSQVAKNIVTSLLKSDENNKMLNDMLKDLN